MKQSTHWLVILITSIVNTTLVYLIATTASEREAKLVWLAAIWSWGWLLRFWYEVWRERQPRKERRFYRALRRS